MMTETEKAKRKEAADAYTKCKEAMRKVDDAASKASSFFIDDEYIEAGAMLKVAGEYLALAQKYLAERVERMKELEAME